MRKEPVHWEHESKKIVQEKADGMIKIISSAFIL